MDLLFNLAEKKINPSNPGVFKHFAINQSDSSLTYDQFLSFLISTNQNKLQWSWNFQQFNVNQSGLISTSQGFFNKFDIVCRYQGILHR